MASSTYYAWSPILVANDKAEKNTIEIGATVTKADVGGDEAWNDLLEARAIRDTKPPDTTGDETQRTAILRQAQALVDSVDDGSYDKPEVVAAMETLQPPNAVSNVVPKEK